MDDPAQALLTFQVVASCMQPASANNNSTLVFRYTVVGVSVGVALPSCGRLTSSGQGSWLRRAQRKKREKKKKVPSFSRGGMWRGAVLIHDRCVCVCVYVLSPSLYTRFLLSWSPTIPKQNGRRHRKGRRGEFESQERTRLYQALLSNCPAGLESWETTGPSQPGGGNDKTKKAKRSNKGLVLDRTQVVKKSCLLSCSKSTTLHVFTTLYSVML